MSASLRLLVRDLVDACNERGEDKHHSTVIDEMSPSERVRIPSNGGGR